MDSLILKRTVMKKILISLLIITPLFLYAQEDTLQHRIGFLVEFQSFAIKQVGIRYRINEQTKVVVTLSSVYDDFEAEGAQQSNRIYWGIGGAVKVEHQIFEIKSVELFLEGGIGIDYFEDKTTTKDIRDNNNIVIDPSHSFYEYSRYYTGIIGAGAEYFLTEQLSLFAHQNLELNYQNKTYIKDFRIDLGMTKIGVTLFL